MKQDKITLGLPPDFVMKIGRLELPHKAQITLIFKSKQPTQVISVCQRSFHTLAKDTARIVLANLEDRNQFEYQLDPVTDDLIFVRPQLTIRVKYCLHNKLSKESRQVLARKFVGIFDDR